MTAPKNKEELIQVLKDQTPKSGEMWQESQEVVPGGLLSLARKFEPYPFYTHRGEGPYIWDVDENRYIDCCMSYGVLLLGHASEVAKKAIAEQNELGASFGTPHPLEIKFSERMIECIPCADRVLLCNSGTEATMQGIRIMRSYTGKDRIGKFESSYHGWHDYAMWNVGEPAEDWGPADKPKPVVTSAGIPKAVEDTMLILPQSEAAYKMIEEHASELAGIMVEPVVASGGMFPLKKEFLEGLREVTKRTGVMLMYDEVITGFRMALGGAQEYYGVNPDLATYGKIIGGGLPAGAVGCSKKIMDAVLQAELSMSVAGTFSGNPMTLGAGYATLGYLMDNPQIYDELEVRGNRLRDGFNEWAQEKGYPVGMTGTGSMFQTHMQALPLEVPRDLKGQHVGAHYDMQLYLRMNGVFLPWLHLAFISAAHSESDVEEVLRVHKLAAESSLKAHGVV
jgi:glutamate-1-semialdehyde 2,1-aminomutase